mmetsp:Transcript_13592/g.20384  ORF Transcript_13592/g.20384 Transcript_13592/m.20384 type:complete len:256 (+) Transcript_13592:101-868(+)
MKPNLTIQQHDSENPVSLAIRKKNCSPQSVSSIPSKFTRTDTESSEPFSCTEYELNTPIREFDFRICTIQSKGYISKTLTGNEFADVKYLGNGSNSLIYTAKRNGEKVAIKMLKQKLHHHDVAHQEMNIEMQILTKIDHPNIIGIKGAGEIPRKFIVVDYLEGSTLDKLLQQYQSSANPQHQQSKHKKCSTGLPISTALSIARDLASALKYLHDDVHPNATVIHRDLKPQNIGFTADRQLKLFDFGLVPYKPTCP